MRIKSGVVHSRLAQSVSEGNCEVVTIDVRHRGTSNIQVDCGSGKRQYGDDQADDQCPSTRLFLRGLTHFATRLTLKGDHCPRRGRCGSGHSVRLSDAAKVTNRQLTPRCPSLPMELSRTRVRPDGPARVDRKGHKSLSLQTSSPTVEIRSWVTSADLTSCARAVDRTQS